MPFDKSRELEHEVKESKKLGPGQEHYRAYVGPPQQFDFMGATQFALLFRLGIREEHFLLDIGCGSLRCGRYFLQFLLPSRYFGVEPNEWLWQDALRNEIGQDIVQFKQPVFSSSEKFEFEQLNASFDYIVAQSIFSHTGHNLFRLGIQNVEKVLSPNGQFLFTVLDENTPRYDFLKEEGPKSGWVYPGCTVIEENVVQAVCKEFGLHVQAINWFHPRQRWYRAVKDKTFLLSPRQLQELGTGRPMFDERF